MPLTIASRYFADLTQEQSTGANPSAPDKPMGTRIVIYANDDGSKKVTLSVDQYASPAEAFSAYAQAVKGSEAAPGAKPTAAPKLGQRSFAGTSQVGSEMHFGLGAVDNRLIVAATYAGYPVTPDFSAKLEALAGQELMVAKQTLASSGSS